MTDRRGMGKMSVVLVLLIWASSAWTQETPLDASPSVDVKLSPELIELRAGMPAELTIAVSVPDGHHAYMDKGRDGMFIPIEMDLSALEQAGMRTKLTGRPDGETDNKVHAKVLRKHGAFVYELTVLPGAKISTGSYDVKIRSQVCNDISGTCYFPRTDTRQIKIGILSVPEAGGDRAPVNTERTGNQSNVESSGAVNFSVDKFPAYQPRTKAPVHKIWVWMLLAFVAGMALNVMPCVLPVISIKIISFVQQAGESRKRMLALGVSFAAGMMAAFMALAVVAILFGLGWGEQFQSQKFLVIMIAVVFAFSLSLFGVFEMGVPSKVSALAGGPHREGLLDAFLMGIMSTVLATPCSGPFLGSTLAWTLAQPPSIILLVFGILGLGMALPYVALTAFPTLLRLLPKPGPWLETFKQIMGFILMGTVVYLMISLDQKLLLFTVAFLVFVAIACGMWGKFAFRTSTHTGRATIVASCMAVMALGAYFSFVVFLGMFSESSQGKTHGLAWEPFDPQRLLEYHRAERTVFVDFMADWCPNCKFNEVTVFNSEEIRRLIEEKNVIAMKADLTQEGPQTDMLRQLMHRLGARSIPFMAVFPGDRPTEPYTRHDLVRKADISDILNSLPD